MNNQPLLSPETVLSVCNTVVNTSMVFLQQLDKVPTYYWHILFALIGMYIAYLVLRKRKYKPSMLSVLKSRIKKRIANGSHRKVKLPDRTDDVLEPQLTAAISKAEKTYKRRMSKQQNDTDTDNKRMHTL